MSESAAPSRLYKYMKANHLEMALSRGTFRIGTLFDFRKIEKFNAEIGDVGEGTKAVHITAQERMSFNLRSDDPRAIHARKILKGWDEFHPAATLVITMEPNASLTLNEESADVYIYCLSMKYDAAQMRTMECDTCLVVTDPQGFFTELSNCLPDAHFVIGADVQYRDRRVDYAMTGVAPAPFVKPDIYAAQCEFRAVWQPHKQPIEPVVVDCPRALLYCAVYEPS